MRQGPFFDLLDDIAAAQDYREMEDCREAQARGQAMSKSLDLNDTIDRLAYSLSREECAARADQHQRNRAAFRRVAIDPLNSLAAQQEAQRPEREQRLAKALAPDIGQMRAMLSEAARNGAPLEAVAQMEARLLRLDDGEAVFKALPAIQMPDAAATNKHSNRAKALPIQTDTSAQVRRASDLLAQLRAENKISATQAAAFEARLIRAQSDESTVQSTDPSRAERMAATAKAGGILRDLARSGKLDALQVASFEAQIHGLGQSLRMGSAADINDPMAAA